MLRIPITGYTRAGPLSHAFLRRCYSSQAKGKPVIGFVGIGQMGLRMSNNLFNKGKEDYSKLLVFDVNQSASKEFQASHSGVEVADTVADLAARSDVVITMLPTPSDVKTVYLGVGGIASTIKPGSLLIDSSTVDPATSQLVAEQISKEYKADAVDAPVSGGVVGAQDGTLTFMVGGTPAQFERTKPILRHMGANLVHCGTSGMGQVAKICNNMLLGTTMIGVCESLNLAVRLGMDPKLMLSILNTSTGRCWTTEKYSPVPGILPNVPSSNNYNGGFGVSLIQKDMGLAISAAQSTKSPVPLSAFADQMYKLVMNTPGLERKDFAVVYEWLANQYTRHMPKKI